MPQAHGHGPLVSDARMPRYGAAVLQGKIVIIEDCAEGTNQSGVHTPCVILSSNWILHNSFILLMAFHVSIRDLEVRACVYQYHALQWVVNGSLLLSALNHVGMRH